MKILVVGNPHFQAEFKSKFGAKHPVTFKFANDLNPDDLISVDAVFDFEISAQSKHGLLYNHSSKFVLLVNSVKSTTSKLIDHFSWVRNVVGFNGLPGMLNRSLLEITCQEPISDSVQKLFKYLNVDYRIVSDQVGMVTPRVLCMIINEAFYAIQEGTANESDINLAMKLGTNYPEGPFEMLEKLGVQNVYEILEALHQSTNDERYQICPLLEERYLNLQI